MEEKSKKKSKLGMLIAVVIIILIVGFASQKLNEKQLNDDYRTDIPEGSDSEMFSEAVKMEKEYYSSINSDIEGMTQWDKIVMGLSYVDGSDTDHDGLSDKDEIEVYYSDPLKASTAGDLYMDGYKVEHDMDINKRYDYEGDFEFPNNSCEELILTPLSPADVYAQAREIENPRQDDIIIFKKYELYNFGGNLSIDVSDIVEKNGVPANDMAVYIEKFGQSEKIVAKTKVVGSVINIKDSFNKNDIYDIFISYNEKSDSFGDMVDKLLKEDSVDPNLPGARFVLAPTVGTDYSNSNMNEKSVPMGYCIGCPISGHFGGKYLVVTNETYNEEYNEYVRQSLAETVRFTVGSRVRIKYKTESGDKIKKKLAFLDDHFSIFELDDPYEMGAIWFFMYAKFYDINGLYYQDENFVVKPEEAAADGNITGFNIAEDTLPFENFQTTRSSGGTCMGISMVTAKVFNNGHVDAEDSYSSIQEGDYSWNLNEDEDNATFSDKGLRDYKDSNFVKDHTDRETGYLIGLSTGEKAVTDMITGYHWFGNEATYVQCKEVHEGREKYRYSSLQNIIDSLEHNYKTVDENGNGAAYTKQVLICGVGVSPNEEDFYGHALVLYGYYTDEEGNLRLKVYDCNYPNDTNLEVVTKRRTTEGGNDTFDFYYTNNHGSDYSSSGYYASKFLVLTDDAQIVFGTDKDVVTTE